MERTKVISLIKLAVERGAGGFNKEELDNMTDEELDRRVFEIECKCEGLDPNHPRFTKET